MITVKPIPAPPINLRVQYLDLLPEPQELFIENKVAKGSCWSICRDGREIGYAVIVGDETLVELHMDTIELRYLDEAFDVLAQHCGVRRILAKSFDANLLYVALPRAREMRITGMLYRVIADASFVEDSAIEAIPATHEDVTSLLELGDGFFDDRDEIESYVRSTGLIVYETRAGMRLGAGVMKRVVPGRDDIDIGMVVDAAHRHRGYGAYIVAHLKSYCLTKELRPICGCAIDNVGSQRALERAGFASRHQIVEFEL
jgi:GNAT superfamily N-acetyltransferase